MFQTLPRRFQRWLAQGWLTFAVILLASPALGSMAATAIPEPLEPWVEWVLHNHPEYGCPHLATEPERHCIWPGRLRLEVSDQGVEFSQTVTLYRDGTLPLPGEPEHWPENLRVNGEPAVLLETGNGLPVTRLPAGEHLVQAHIRWQTRPRLLRVPEQTGLIVLQVDGQNVSPVRLEASSQVVLGDEPQPIGEPQRQDTLNLRVYRLLQDGPYQQLTTQVHMDVSGAERELLLGQILPPGFRPRHLDSSLPARVEPDGQLRVQLRPGRWLVELQSYSLAHRETLGFSRTTDHWPDNEIWSLSTDPQYRTVQVAGGVAVDPSQTSLPQHWHGYPAFRLAPQTPLTLEEPRKAPSGFDRHDLRLNRELWLSFDGSGFVARDRIQGQLSGFARLETREPFTLRSATSASTPLLVSYLEDPNRPGIEVRSARADITALSILPRRYSLPVSGWQQDFSRVSTQLHLPPGWSLLTAVGTDHASGAWLNNWTLWGIFLVLLISLVVGRCGGWPLGLLTLFTLLLLYQRPGAPVLLWLNLAACLVMFKLVTERWLKPVRIYTLASFAVLAAFLLPFVAQQARLGLYPHLEHRHVQEASKRDEILEEIMVTSMRSPRAALERASMAVGDMMEPQYAPSLSAIPLTTEVASLDHYGDDQLIQSGPPKPDWYWHTSHLHWGHAVDAERTTRLLLVPPLINRLGYFLAALAPLLLALLLWRSMALPTPTRWRSPPTGSAAVLLAVLLFLPGEQAQAQSTPAPELLRELEKRLTQIPDCIPRCAAIESVSLRIENDSLTIRMRIHAAEPLAFPLPVQPQHWQPEQVLLNGAAAPVARDGSGQLVLRVPRGSHLVALNGSLADVAQLDLPFGLPIRNLQSAVDGWRLSGAPRGRITSQDLRLERTRADTDDSAEVSFTADEMPPFVRITRTLNMAHEWTLDTRVQRLAPQRGAINLTVPLLPGEVPLSGDVIEDNAMAVSLSPSAMEYSWTSHLSPRNELILQAPQDEIVPWHEVWTVNASLPWHVQIAGDAPLHFGEGEHASWRPGLGDRLTLTIARPAATSGETLTINRAYLHQEQNPRGQNTSLSLNIKTYQGGYYDFTLPDNAELTELTVRGQRQPLRDTRGELRIPITPGEQSIELRWRTAKAMGAVVRTPAIDLGHHAGNIFIRQALPDNRLVLATGGPRVGPVVLLWSALLIVLLAAYGLNRTGMTPLKTWEWALLGVGTLVLSLYLLLLVALCFMALWWRGQYRSAEHSRFFNTSQVLLVMLSLLSLAAMISIIPLGLTTDANTIVTGNASRADLLTWYVDYSPQTIAATWVFSLPGWAYRVAMLGWSLWLAFALTRWLPWGWRQLRANGGWRKWRSKSGKQGGNNEVDPTPGI